ncbi:ATP-binding protein [Streptomyces sp. V3I7]|uniref:ATP-binding protein n=1 Tax=Streptomyces sp. V3I7 TaxID=3042278 RepID=UPI0027D86432|nr:ATP-binding protein [Streptomyces sp. V3I7]
MATGPRWRGSTPLPEETYRRTVSFPGDVCDVTNARLSAQDFLGGLARVAPPSAPDRWDDILLVVTELAANAVQYAPGRFGLTMRRTYDGVHVTMHDTSTVRPEARPFSPRTGGRGIGWRLVQTLCDQVSVIVTANGKDIHVFLPW